MVLDGGLRSPRHILVLFLGTTFFLLAGLAWLASRTLARDHAVEVQRVREQLESATELIAAEIRQNLTDIGEDLTRMSLLPAPEIEGAALEYSRDLEGDSLLVVFGPDSVEAYPQHRLLYYPALPRREAVDTRPFQTGELLEFRERDFVGAATYFEQLARAYENDDSQIRAGALVRLARNQRKAGRSVAALHTYRRLSSLSSATVGDWPAELVGLRARCELLAELGREDDLETEARQLAADLHGGRWPLSRSAYQHFAEELEKWLKSDGERLREWSSPLMFSLASAVGGLWELWQVDRSSSAVVSGRRSLVSEGRSVFLLWRGTADQLVALVAGPEFLSRRVADPLEGLIERQGIALVLADGEGNTLVSGYENGSPDSLTVIRTMADTRLPWTLRVMSTQADADLARVAVRGRLLMAGLGFMALLAVAVSYFSARAMSREIEVARLQSDFVAAVSHEFRTPLTTLRQFTDLLADGRIASDQERKSCYAALQRGTRRLTHLVENLLDFGRMEAGHHGFILEPLEAKEWVERIVGEFRHEVEGQSYSIELSWSAPEDLSLRADDAALGRALWNLLDNAVKYSPSNKTIRVGCTLEGQGLIIRVQDRGIGVPVEERNEIFRKFVRGSQRKDHAVKGAGLGLALVDQIVRAHGGTVSVESKLGEGSIFSLLLPVREVSVHRILIIEDEPDIALGLQKDLELEGYEVETAADGEQGVGRVQNGAFDLILLDIMLPGKDGFAVCRELRRSGVRAPIILLTAKRSEAEKVLGLELGADDYVTKPFGPMELRARIKAVLRRRSADHPELIRFDDFEVDFERFELRRGGKPVDLTPIEFKLLAAFVRSPRAVLSRQQLLDKVWGSDVYVTDRVVDTHIGNLRRKIETNPEEPAFVISVRGFGYRFEG